MEKLKEIIGSGTNWFRIALVVGIIFLALYEKDGWGWLVFILLWTL